MCLNREYIKKSLILILDGFLLGRISVGFLGYNSQTRFASRIYICSNREIGVNLASMQLYNALLFML